MRLVRGIERQSVDIGSQTRGGRGIGASHMVVDAGLFCASLHTLLDQMDEIRGAKFSQSREAFCPGVDSESDIVILDDPMKILSKLIRNKGRRWVVM